MSSIVQSFQKRLSSYPTMPVSQSLPLSQTHSDQQGLRRRLSSFSLKIHPTTGGYGSSSGAWSFPRSKSLSSMGEYAGSSIRKWWDWGWGWVLSKKPIFTRDLEMNEEESKALGSQSRGSLKHVLYKVRSEIRKLVGSENVGLPQTYRYDSSDYSKNFDNGIGIRSQG